MAFLRIGWVGAGTPSISVHGEAPVSAATGGGSAAFARVASEPTANRTIVAIAKGAIAVARNGSRSAAWRRRASGRNGERAERGCPRMPSRPPLVLSLCLLLATSAPSLVAPARAGDGLRSLDLVTPAASPYHTIRYEITSDDRPQPRSIAGSFPASTRACTRSAC